MWLSLPSFFLDKFQTCKLVNSTEGLKSGKSLLKPVLLFGRISYPILVGEEVAEGDGGRDGL